MTAFKYLKSLRRKRSHEEAISQHENLTAEETPAEIPAHKNKEVVENQAFVPGFKLTPMGEKIEPNQAAHDLSEVEELTEAAENLFASSPSVEAELENSEIPQTHEVEVALDHSEIPDPIEVEAELDHSEIPQTHEAELDPAHEPAVMISDSPESAELSVRLKSLMEEKDALFDRLLRKQAEFENFRKRTEKEKQEFYDFALSSFVQTLLPVLDGLERSLIVQEGETVESFRKGNELILKQFRDQLWAAGIQPIRSMGKIFDPNFHQAVMREESSTLAENEIIEEYQRGYLFKDRLLRPSMVKVATASPPPATESGPDPVETPCHEGETPSTGETGTEG